MIVRTPGTEPDIARHFARRRQRLEHAVTSVLPPWCFDDAIDVGEPIGRQLQITRGGRWLRAGVTVDPSHVEIATAELMIEPLLDAVTRPFADGELVYCRRGAMWVRGEFLRPARDSAWIETRDGCRRYPLRDVRRTVAATYRPGRAIALVRRALRWFDDAEVIEHPEACLETEHSVLCAERQAPDHLVGRWRYRFADHLLRAGYSPARDVDPAVVRRCLLEVHAEQLAGCGVALPVG